MKISNNIISKTTAAYKNWREPEYQHALAKMYWHVMLGLTTLIAFGSIAYGMVSLQMIATEQDAGKSTTIVASPKVDRTNLNGVLLGFTRRETQFNSLISGSGSMSDPSR